MSRILSVPFLSCFASALSAQEHWQEFRVPLSMEFPNGHKVVKTPRADAEVVKPVPGPTVATVKWHYRNEFGILFYLSDWSAERRFRGEGHFLILPNSANMATPVNRSQDTVFDPPISKMFEFGFEIVESASPNGKIASKVEGPARTNVKAKRRLGNEIYYISDWNWNRIQRGKPGNWMRAVQGRKAPEIPKTNPLPGTGEEIAGLAPMLQSAGFQVESISGVPATEARFLDSIRSSDVLHLAHTDSF
ncbi:MAG: hypothetical protein P1U87_06585 [Verrucomicrobiales bacterium]|nr:hypothetical protein [Verrucomicrobiales bacterium]